MISCSQQTVLRSIREETIKDNVRVFQGNAFISLAILYTMFSICNWIAPSYIAVTGPRVAIVTGACCYGLFIASFFYPHEALLYCMSVLVGFGAALIWTGHGQYLTENSTNETMSRNAGLFWAIFQMSMFIGNLLVFFTFTTATIDKRQRMIVFGVLTGLAVIGIGVLLLLRRTSQKLSLGEAEGVSNADKELRLPERQTKPLLIAWHAFVDSIKLFLTKNMLLLSLTFIYTGLEQTFYSGVYSSSIGFVKALGDKRKSFVGLSGICIGVGEVAGGAVFGILASKLPGKCSGWPVIITGLVVHLFAFITIFLNLPNDAPFADTESKAFIPTSPVLALAGSLALGFGDACYNTQIYTILGVLFAKESAPAFALFKFCQSVATAVSFYYSTEAGLYVQLAILLVGVIIGTGAFCYVEYRVKKENETSRKIDPTLVDATSGED